jgi:hypothetical protein
MFFDIESDFDEERFLILMFVLNASRGEGSSGMNVGVFRRTIASTVSMEVSIDDILSLYYLGLLSLWQSNGDSISGRDATDNDILGLTFKGMAVLINSANRYLDGVVSTYDVPDAVTASLIPFLDIGRVPAADRYVSTADNQELFNELANDLEAVKNELIRDQNANEIPIALQTKRAMAAELEGLVGQIRAGFVRLSDLTVRARPLVKTIADVCKDIGVIGGVAYAAYELIGKILSLLF